MKMLLLTLVFSFSIAHASNPVSTEIPSKAIGSWMEKNCNDIEYNKFRSARNFFVIKADGTMIEWTNLYKKDDCSGKSSVHSLIESSLLESYEVNSEYFSVKFHVLTGGSSYDLTGFTSDFYFSDEGKTLAAVPATVQVNNENVWFPVQRDIVTDYEYQKLE